MEKLKRIHLNTKIATALHSNQHVKCIPLSNYHVNSDDLYLTLFKINLFLWWHFDISSVLLFNRTFGSGRAIIIFSVRHKSRLVPHVYRDAYVFYTPFQMIISPICFQRPKLFGQFRNINMGFVSERVRMIVVSRFELPL